MAQSLSTIYHNPRFSRDSSQNTMPVKKFKPIERYVLEYVQNNYTEREKQYTDKDSSPTPASVGVELTREAIPLAAKKFGVSELEIACWLDGSETFPVLGCEGDWDTFEGFAFHYDAK